MLMQGGEAKAEDFSAETPVKQVGSGGAETSHGFKTN
jgi:hypothetical protein